MYTEINQATSKDLVFMGTSCIFDNTKPIKYNLGTSKKVTDSHQKQSPLEGASRNAIFLSYLDRCILGT